MQFLLCYYNKSIELFSKMLKNIIDDAQLKTALGAVGVALVTI